MYPPKPALPLSLLLLYTFFTGFLPEALAISFTPKIIRLNRKIVVQMSPDAPRMSKMALEILESSDCETQQPDSKTITYPENCHLLHGVLKYQFTTENEGKLKKAYTEFLLTQPSSKGHVFLVNSPVIVDGE